MKTSILSRWLPLILGGMFLFLFLKGDSCGKGATTTCVGDEEVYAQMELAPSYASPIPRYCHLSWVPDEQWTRVGDFEEIEVLEIPDWLYVEVRGPEKYLQVVAAPSAPRGAEGQLALRVTWRSPGFDTPFRGMLRVQVTVASLVGIDTQDFYANSTLGLLLGSFLGSEEAPIVSWEWSVVFRPHDGVSPGSSMVVTEGRVARVSPVYAGTYLVELELVDSLGRKHRTRREILVESR